MPRAPRYTPDELRAVIEESRSISEVLRRLNMRPAGGNHRTIKKHAEAWGISMRHFDPYADQRGRPLVAPKPLSEVLVENSTYSRGTLKRRLYAEGLKERRCEMCAQGELWHGRRMALILDHVNGIADDNRLENLRIVCPNCAATLDTHCGRNPPLERARACTRCGREFEPRGATHRYCSRACGIHSPGPRDPQPGRRKVDRPSYEQLLADLEASSFSAVGRKYGVSDNAVRKWLRWYEQERSDEAA